MQIISGGITGTKFFGRKEFDKLLKKVKPQDLIVFDEVSRMSRDAEDGVEQYFELFDNGVDLLDFKRSLILIHLCIEKQLKKPYRVQEMRLPISILKQPVSCTIIS